jgi:hypothetical protein
MTSSLAEEIVKISQLDPTRATEQFNKLIESVPEQVKVKEDVAKAYEIWDQTRRKWINDGRQIIEAYRFNKENCVDDPDLAIKYENVIEGMYVFSVQEENFEYFLSCVGVDCYIPKIFEIGGSFESGMELEDLDEDCSEEDGGDDDGGDEVDYLSDLEDD